MLVCSAPDATVVVSRRDLEIFVALAHQAESWTVSEAIDEDGNPATLSPDEKRNACDQASAGIDLTGR